MRMRFQNSPLARVAAGTAAALGVLLLLADVALLIAVLTTREGRAPFLAAAAQILAGGINLTMIRSIWRHELHGIAICTATTIAVSVVLVLTTNSSELIVFLQLHLLLLCSSAYRERSALTA